MRLQFTLRRISMLRTLSLRLLRLIFGLMLISTGSYLTIQANTGLAPWEAFTKGVSQALGLKFGVVMIGTSIVIVLLDFLLNEKIGFGTILNGLLLGVFTELLLELEPIPLMESFFPGVALLLLGQVIVCLGTFFYIGAAGGCGPRDSLMVALGKRIDKLPIGVVRGALEGFVLMIGWILGAKVGVGTVISVFGIGLALQLTFKLLRFDVKAVRHESCADTIRSIVNRRSTETV
jgi:uncharacterized membrane protein YczE